MVTVNLPGATPAPDLPTDPIPTWHHDAACLGLPVDQFFPAPNRAGANTATKARRICAGCPVKADCLEEALSRHGSSDFGIWGATTRVERDELRRQRRDHHRPAFPNLARN